MLASLPKVSITGQTRRLAPWLRFLVPAAVLAVALAGRGFQSAWTERIRNQGFDTFQRLSPRAYEEAPVRILDIDEESLRRFGQWPWPRTVIAKLVDRLREQGASVVAFDIVLSEPDRTSPLALLRYWKEDRKGTELERQLSRLPDHDEALAAAMRKIPVVTGFFPADRATSALPTTRTRVKSGDLSAVINWFPGATPTLARLERAAAGNASLGYVPEPDGIVRRAPLIVGMGAGEALMVYPTLAVDAVRAHTGARGIVVVSRTEVDDKGRPTGTFGIEAVQLGPLKVPTDGAGRIWVHFTENRPQRTLPVWRVLDKDLPPGSLQGKIVFVGTSATGLKDMRATPLHAATPGVEVHAQVAEQLLLKRFLRRPYWAGWLETVFLALLGVFLIVLMPRLGPGWCFVLGATAIGGAVVGSYRAYTEGGLLLDPGFPSLTVIAVYFASSLMSHIETESERRQVRNAFSRYMHPKLVEELARHPEKLRLGGETRPMTVLFCDIRGFTTISEQYDAHGLTHVINRFLTPMTGIIMERSGTIDKYIGDCIMAFWNAPLDDADHAANACSAALSMIAGLGSVNATLKAEAQAAGKKFHELRIGVGLNTGDCCVGNMGSDQRFNYSVLGDDVNLASRLEGQSKAYGVDIVIGPRTRELAPGFAAIELDLIKVKGKTRPVRIYSLLGDRARAADPKFRELAESHARMLEAYSGQDWDAAEKALKSGAGPAEAFRLTKLTHLYEDRIKGYRAAPPGKDWDGAYTALTK